MKCFDEVVKLTEITILFIINSLLLVLFNKSLKDYFSYTDTGFYEGDFVECFVWGVCSILGVIICGVLEMIFGFILIAQAII